MVGGNRGQIHPIYSLADRHRPLKFHGRVGIGSVLTEDRFEAVEAATELFEMADCEKFQCPSYLLRVDGKIWSSCPSIDLTIPFAIHKITITSSSSLNS